MRNFGGVVGVTLAGHVVFTGRTTTTYSASDVQQYAAAATEPVSVTVTDAIGSGGGSGSGDGGSGDGGSGGGSGSGGAASGGSDGSGDKGGGGGGAVEPYLLLAPAITLLARAASRRRAENNFVLITRSRARRSIYR